MDEATRFARSLELVLKHEGGFVNHPADPGGATNKGVTQKTYDGWRLSQALPKRSVRFITVAELTAIYRKHYWVAASCDELPAGVDYMVFDLAVNSGPGRAAKFLQEAVRVEADGEIGPKTLAAVRLLPPSEVVLRMRNRRERFYRALGTFPTFGKGWMRRLDEVFAIANEWARVR